MKISGQNTVVTNGEVWINGEKCYPSSLIEELDSAYSMLVTAAAIVSGGSGGMEWGEHYQEACGRVERARRALEL